VPSPWGTPYGLVGQTRDRLGTCSPGDRHESGAFSKRVVQSPYRETSECQHVAGGAQQFLAVSKSKQNVAALDLDQTILPLAFVEPQVSAPGDDNDADLERMERRLL
jgi:hypothetical protein